MPQINLFSPEGAKKPKRIKTSVDKEEALEPPQSFYRIAIITGVILIFLWLLLSIRIRIVQYRLNSMQQKLDNLATDPKQVIKFNNEKMYLEQRFSFLDELVSRKFLWSDKLDRIAELIPDGVWLTNISLEKRKISATEKKPSSFVANPDDEEMQDVVLITGRAVAYEIQDAIDLVGKFIDLLKQDKVFAAGFSDFKFTVAKGAIAKTDIMNFELTCIMGSQMD